MNLSIKIGVFPTLWKTAKICPLFKSGDKKDVNNYRPISLLPIFGKILEKHVSNTLRKFFNENNLLYKRQFGFRKLHSTSDALLSIKRKIVYSLNKRQKCLMVLIDIRKAFDLINHNKLLQKLKAYGCDRESLNWFESYLRDRYNFVISNKKISKPLRKDLSVPQRGCLSALLFIIFMNDIFELALNDELFLFADDLTLIVYAKNYSQLERNTNEDLRKINEWLNKNRLVPNLDKSNFLLMGCPFKTTSININLNGNNLKRVYETKLLGVIIDHDLKFDEHIRNLCKSISI
jgi:hypothetical protein